MTFGVFNLHAEVSLRSKMILGAIPFILILVGYGIVSHFYLSANPAGKIFPSYWQMASKLYNMATVPNARSGDILLWVDTVASLRRLFIGLAIGTFVGFAVGMNMGFFPRIRAVFLPFITAVSNIPIIAVLAIVMIAVGVGEAFKIDMIILGVVFLISRDMFRATIAIDDKQIIKAQTLGASTFRTVYEIMFPQLMPHLLSAVRLALGAAWIFLLSAEMIASTEGLGYRIFLVRRYLDMQTIIPYVFVIGVYAYAIDYMIALCVRIFYPWFGK